MCVCDVCDVCVCVCVCVCVEPVHVGLFNHPKWPSKFSSLAWMNCAFRGTGKCVREV